MLKVSVVIPTVGDRTSINCLIDSLLSQSVTLESIIIVVPKVNREVFFEIFNDQADLVKVIFAPYSSQVRQRIYGFKNCQRGLILQIDDDVSIGSSHFVEKLIANFLRIQSKLGTSKISIGPLLIVSDPSLIAKFKRLVAKLLCGISPPKISIFGGGSYPQFAPDWNVSVSLEPLEAEWLPGGLLLSHSSAVNLTNYFPFKGRAEAEDIVDAVKKRQNGVRLFLCPDVKIEILKGSNNISINDLKKQCDIAIYINKKVGKKLFFAPLTKYLLKRLVHDLGQPFRRIG